MKFMVGDLIRHVNGVKEFVVHTVDRVQCVYGLKEDGSPVIQYYSDCHVDKMYKHVSETSDPPVKQSEPKAVTEYEVDCFGAKTWTHCHAFPSGTNLRYTGRTRKVVVQ